MLHIIGQMRNMFMANLMSNQMASGPESGALETSLRPKERPEHLGEDRESIKGVTKEDLQNLEAAKQILDAGKVIEKGASTQAVIDVQEMLVYLNYDIGDFGPNKNGVDGDFGKTMTQVVRDFQLDSGLPETGVVDKTTYDAMLTKVNTKGGVSAETATTGNESLSTMKVESTLNDYSGKKIADMDTFEKKALQRDINSILVQKGEALITVDGKVGPGTKAAMEKIGFGEDALVSLRDAAQKARNEKSLETSSKSIESFPTEKAEADKIVKLFALDISDGAVTTLIQKIALLTDIKDIDGDGKEDWNEDQKARRLVVAQYITDSLASQVDAGEVSAIRASQVIEGLLAQEKFESKPGRDAIARMLGTIPELIASTKDESGQEITAKLDKNSALKAILRSQEPMDMGVSLERGYFQVAGQKYDIDRAEDMFVVTGNGNQRISIRETGALKLTNVAIVGNVLVGLMGNGCEGNVVYIPLDTNPAPKKAVPKKPTSQPEPQPEPNPETPETGRKCRMEEKCEGGYIWKRQYCWDAGTWGKNPTYGPWERTNETCGGSDGDKDTVGTNPGIGEPAPEPTNPGGNI